MTDAADRLLRFTAIAVLVVASVVFVAAQRAAAEEQWQALVGGGGRVTISHAGRQVGVATAGLFEAGWQAASAVAVEGGAPGRPLGVIRAPSGKMVDAVLQADAVSGGIRLHYSLTPRSDMNLNSLHVSLEMPISLVAGGAFVADGQRGTIPQTYDATHVWTGTPRQVQLSLTGGAILELRFDAPQPVLLQDDRQWGPSFSVRIGPQLPDGQVWPSGKPYDVTFTITTAEGMSVDFDQPVTIEAGKDWVPLQPELDIEPGSAVDFSGFGQFEGPAGAHGRVIATPDGEFAFEDQPGVPRRFYGVNLCFTAQYLPHDQADRLAERLMRLGYNAVRIHHYESSLVDTSGGATSTTLRPVSIDQLDYLLAALKKRGIYVTTDLFVSRPVFAGEVWPGAGGRVAMDDFKMLVLVNEQALQNWEAFTRNLLSHRNLHTGMTWAEDPTLAWLSMINEGNAGNFIGGLKGRVADDWQRAWNVWLAKKYGDRATLAKAWGADPQGDPVKGTVPLERNAFDERPAGRDCAVFLAETERSAFEQMRRFIRDELGCRALLTNMNSWTSTLQTQAVREEFDYVDEHFYVDHPQFLENAWQLPSRNPNASPIAGGATGGRDKTFLRLLNKPFTITEYNYAAPGRYRGVGGIITGCMAALQGWDGLWRFAYSHSSANLFTPAGVDYFDMVCDPLNQTAERAAMALYLRGDMGEAKHTVAVPMTGKELLDDPKHHGGVAPSWNALGLVTRVGTLVTDKAGKINADIVVPLAWDAGPQDWGGVVLAADPYNAATGQKVLDAMKAKGWLKGNVTDLPTNRLESENGELLIDAPRDTMVLDTPRTAGGYAPEGGKIAAGPVTITMDRTFATVWVSSLDDQPIQRSSRMLIAHLTDLQNTGERFGEKACQTLLDWGKLPYLVRDGEATMSIKLDGAKAAHVWAVATSGRRVAPVDATLKDGTLTVPLKVRGPQGAQLMYEVQVER